MIVGRFAPSPTGPLHLGSLITAVASFLDVKSQGGTWFVRFDDIDPPRQHPAAIELILGALEAHSLTGDREVDFQSRHNARYNQALERLAPHCFYCTCSRRMLADLPVYPGTCRGVKERLPDAALRLRLPDENLHIDDGLLGPRTFNLAETFGDTIIKRRDGLWAYHLATAVDDGLDVTHVLRGQDLYATTPIHVYIMRQLGLTPPAYTHLPLLHFADGSKLSKQTHAPAVDNASAAANLRRVLALLGQNPPQSADWPASEWLRWGIANWRLANVPESLEFFTEKR